MPPHWANAGRQNGTDSTPRLADNMHTTTTDNMHNTTTDKILLSNNIKVDKIDSIRL